jgi:hypothetical protein
MWLSPAVFRLVGKFFVLALVIDGFPFMLLIKLLGQKWNSSRVKQMRVPRLLAKIL